MNELSFKVPLKPVLKQAEGFYILLKRYEETTRSLPASISTMIFPNKNDDQHSNSDTTSIKSPRNNDVQLKTPRRNSAKLYSINGIEHSY